MAKWCTVLPILSATVIAVVLCPGTAIVDSRLQLAKSWVDTQWSRLQLLEHAPHGLNMTEVSSSSNFSHNMSIVSKQTTSTDNYAPSAGGRCQLSGTVQDCCCDYVSVEKANKQHLNPLLTQLVKTPFFRYFKVNLWCDCSFWPDDSMCMLRDCSVCECADEEVPQVWKAAEDSCKESSVELESAVQRTVSPDMQQQLLNIPGWRGFNNPWMAEDDQDVDFSYINLVDNPERFTGYKGEHAHRVWNAIYSQQCFSNLNDTDTCQEQRIFYRLISGMHASISAHIANEYLMDQEKEIWGQNLREFVSRHALDRKSVV